MEELRELTLELDADSLVYSIGFSAESLGEDIKIAYIMLDKKIEQIYEDTQCSECNFYLGTKTNYRNSIATVQKYKGNRDGQKRPIHYDVIRERLIDVYKATLVEDQEAEDAVGIAAYTYNNYNDYIIGHVDKDLNMLAGNHYNFNTRKSYFLDEIQALRNFYTQLVTGDSTDNIPGIYKLLLAHNHEEQANKFKYSRYKKRLEKALSTALTENEMYSVALSFYKDNFEINLQVYKEIIEIGKLLWIRRYKNELWDRPGMRDFDYITRRKLCGQQ